MSRKSWDPDLISAFICSKPTVVFNINLNSKTQLHLPVEFGEMAAYLG